MNIFTSLIGCGLDDSQRQALLKYCARRNLLLPDDRPKLDAELPIKYQNEMRRTKKFAFWIVLIRVQQDQPLFFWSGLFFLAMAILQFVWDAVRYFMS